MTADSICGGATTIGSSTQQAMPGRNNSGPATPNHCQLTALSDHSG